MSGRRFHLHLLTAANLVRILTCSPCTSIWSLLATFHDEEYLEALRRGSYSEDFGLVDDCAPFPMLWPYACQVAQGSVVAARALAGTDADAKVDIAIHWDGGRHHAKRDEAGGFCFVNDAVLAILELRKSMDKVLYLDVDVHHGDGRMDGCLDWLSSFVTHTHTHTHTHTPHTTQVSNRLSNTLRMFSRSPSITTPPASFQVSYHHPLEERPKRARTTRRLATGSLDDRGKGKAYDRSLNIPLHAGLDDATFAQVFSLVATRIHDVFQPDAVVMVCGADGLAGDPNRIWNLTEKGLLAAVDVVRQWNLPLLLLGGGTFHQQPRETLSSCGSSFHFCFPHHHHHHHFQVVIIPPIRLAYGHK